MTKIKPIKTESFSNPINTNKLHKSEPKTKNQKPKTANKQWHVYLLECQDGSFYTGTTNDIDKRMKTHTNGTGSKYVNIKGFKKLLATKQYTDRSDACKAECKIRKLSKWNKLNWFNN